MNTETVTVDLREDFRNGREPFSKIMQAASVLEDGQQLLLLVPFEPVPLFGVLAKQGFQHTAQQQPSGDWEVRFTRSGPQNSALPEERPEQRGTEGASAAHTLEVDARGLEPPLPLIKILESVASLPAGAALRARTDRRPIHLYAELEERGFGARTEEQADGSFLTNIFAR